jgi:hypothetical protein
LGFEDGDEECNDGEGNEGEGNDNSGVLQFQISAWGKRVFVRLELHRMTVGKRARRSDVHLQQFLVPEARQAWFRSDAQGDSS